MTPDQLEDLPWPDDVPVLEADDFDGYTQSLGRGRKHIREWALQTFEDRRCFEQFLYLLFDVIQDHCDPRDAGQVTLSQVPATPDYTYTCVPYSTREVAAWWNEALRRAGYDIEED